MCVRCSRHQIASSRAVQATRHPYSRVTYSRVIHIMWGNCQICLAAQKGCRKSAERQFGGTRHPPRVFLGLPWLTYGLLRPSSPAAKSTQRPYAAAAYEYRSRGKAAKTSIEQGFPAVEPADVCAVSARLAGRITVANSVSLLGRPAELRIIPNETAERCRLPDVGGGQLQLARQRIE
jgi:hypothetical protein